MYETFIDLDELVVRCRDKQAKKIIQEAVACYRTGAFRSCIVSTWNAVVFDFLHKLRELELLENTEASKLLKDFENLSLASDLKVRELWKFESEIPNKALSTFELISPMEKSDIERLFEDRSRCAHPSMVSLEEPFEATAELARYHLRSAVMHLLQRPPVQGRSALNQIWQAIKSEYFPTDIENAVSSLSKGPLARARCSLIKNVVIGLTKSLLNEELPEDERERQFAALNAVSKMYPKETNETLNAQLSTIILRVVDTGWDKVIIYLDTVKAWESTSEPCQIKARTFIERLDIYEEKSSYFTQKLSIQKVDLLVKASRIDFLTSTVINKFQIPFKDLLFVKKHCYDKQFNAKIINPLLRKFIPQASFTELITILTNDDQVFNEEIESYFKDKIKESPVKNIISSLQRCENEKINKLSKDFLKSKIKDASLDELILIKEYFEYFDDEFEEQDKDIIELHKVIETYLYKLVKECTFEEIDQLWELKSQYPDINIDEHINFLLKTNVSNIIDAFMKSGTFATAKSNASLLSKIVDFLTPVQWDYILKAFCSNNQIYNSFGCPDIFISMFKKSVEMHGNVQPYWLSFREKLDSLNDTDINRLKQVIDSYQPI
ncbi:MAG: hypothetical protein IGS23_24835 [Rivularia sp. T60_A2020_040]|nr:hypothetical protein [Rivularia sp. T60_A2020_040]